MSGTITNMNGAKSDPVDETPVDPVDETPVDRSSDPTLGIELRGVSKRFGGVEALKPLDLSVARGTFLALLGPSGCGKSTTLRIIAGLETPSSGQVILDGKDVTDSEARHRDIAMVFQNYALYPHLTVRANLEYPLKARRMKKSERRLLVERVAGALGLSELLDRRPKQLSGGQRQRVALGRSMVRKPTAFLMDEPLSNLDAKLRVQMRAELKHLHQELNVTTVYVTHDQIEATTMADLVAVMNGGRLEQLAKPRDLYAHPANTFVASFTGSPPMNLIRARASAQGLCLEAEDLVLPLQRVRGQRLASLADEHGGLTVGVRPEAVRARVDPSEGVLASVFAVQPLEHELLVSFTLGSDFQILGRFPADASFTMGEQLHIAFAEEQLHLFDGKSGMALKLGAAFGRGAPKLEQTRDAHNRI